MIYRRLYIWQVGVQDIEQAITSTRTAAPTAQAPAQPQLPLGDVNEYDDDEDDDEAQQANQGKDVSMGEDNSLLFSFVCAFIAL